jgi:transposase
VQKEREEFAETIKEIDATKLVALDESSINLAFSRNYGRNYTCKRIKEGRKDVRFERTSILSTVRLNGDMCPLIFNGTLNKVLFAEYIKTRLKPTLADDDILLLDNSSVHKSKLVLDTLKECRIRVLWLPRYSPDYNPIELLWSNMKSVLRKLKARTHERLRDGVNFALDSVPIRYIYGWFRHCGYSVSL